MTETEQAPPGVDATRPSPARLYDYFLGGTTNFAVDRAAAEHLKAAAPDLIDAVWANRGFHGRAGGWLAGRGCPRRTTPTRRCTRWPRRLAWCTWTTTRWWPRTLMPSWPMTGPPR